jgi:p-cumate 2,3-dioxygenase beta subunit
MSVEIDRPAAGAVRTGDATLNHAVEQFLYEDAALLDEWRLEEWLALFTDDCTYYVPATDRPDGDPLHDLFLVQDDRFLLANRVEGLLNGTAWAESPRSTTQRMIANVRSTRAASEILVRANFVVYRCVRQQVDVYPGRYEMTLVEGGEHGFLIRQRKAILALPTLRPAGRVSIIL